jgi:hypothetical protein
MHQVWTEFMLKDTQGMTGAYVAKIIEAASNALRADLAFLTNVDGASIGNLPIDELVPVRTLIEACAAVMQFDWADIYLFELSADVDQASLAAIGNYPDKIRRSRAAIRAVDSTFVYIYVRQDDSVDLKKRLNTFASSRDDELAKIVFSR